MPNDINRNPFRRPALSFKRARKHQQQFDPQALANLRKRYDLPSPRGEPPGSKSLRKGKGQR